MRVQAFSHIHLCLWERLVPVKVNTFKIHSFSVLRKLIHNIEDSSYTLYAYLYTGAPLDQDPKTGLSSVVTMLTMLNANDKMQPTI